MADQPAMTKDQAKAAAQAALENYKNTPVDQRETPEKIGEDLVAKGMTTEQADKVVAKLNALIS